MHIQQIAWLVLVALFWSAQAVYAQAQDDPWADWQLNLSTKKIDHYLNYPTSSIRSLVKVNLNYAQPTTGAPKVYEDLYYSTDRIIGCKRAMDPLGITPGTAGIIKITSTSQSESYALADAALHAYLDLSLHKCMTKYIQVPSVLFGSIISALCEQGFHRGPGSRPGLISIRLVADDQTTEILRMP
jgi:hypothetical protein